MTTAMDAREAVLHYAKRLGPDGLTTGTSGNISARLGDHIAVTPRGMDYQAMTLDDVCVVTIDGGQVSGRFAPSGETPIHLALYADPAVGAVVHMHSPFATVLSTTVDVLPAIHYMVAQLGGPVRVAPYAMPGSDALVASILSGISERSAVLMQNHGALVTGPNLHEAYKNAITLEWLSTLYHRSRQTSAKPRILTSDEYAAVEARAASYGRQTVAPGG